MLTLERLSVLPLSRINVKQILACAMGRKQPIFRNLGGLEREASVKHATPYSQAPHNPYLVPSLSHSISGAYSYNIHPLNTQISPHPFAGI